MEAPAVVLVSPSPLKLPSSTSSSSSNPSPASTNTSRSTTSSHPQSRFSRIEQERTSSETSIFSIYSMYGDEQANRASWSASSPLNANRKTRETKIITAPVDLTASSAHGNAYHKAGECGSDDRAWYGSNAARPDLQPRPVDLVVPQPLSKKASTVDSGYAAQSRPPSTHSSHPPSMRVVDNTKPSSVPQHRLRQASSHTGVSKEQQPESLSNRLSHSSTPSPHRQSELSVRDLPPLPPSRQSSPPARQPSPALAHLDPSPSSSLPLKHPPSASALSSHVSLVPSEGEDLDAFHVRNTYAQLEAVGVKGDGYEEGVERTRARIGNSRSSQLNADAALADGSEKKGDLDPRELATLASVDRYGFFTVPSHDRLILLSSAPLQKRLARAPSTDAAPATPRTLSSLPPTLPPIKEPSRIEKWTRMLRPVTRDQGGNVQTWGMKSSKENKLRPRVYKGIPDRWRSAAWEYTMCRYASMSLAETLQLGEEYRDCLEKPSTYDIQIDLDVPRTISGHVMFRTRYGAGQRSLFHVLHSFSLRCKTCGYVQGMGPIAATLLCYFEPERVYAAMVRLHDSYAMHTVFSPGFPGLLEAIYVQERIMEQFMPDVYAAFKKHMISTTSYATKWYITLFANSVPFQTQLRLWDAFLLDGYDVFIAVAIAILWVYRDHITSSAANFETVLSLLSSFFVPEDENLLLSWIEKLLADKKLRANMAKWREDWKGLVASGKANDALL